MRLACSERIALGDNFRDRLAYLQGFGFEGIEARLPAAQATPQLVDEMAQALSESPVKVSVLIVPGDGYTTPIDTADRRAMKWAHTRSALEFGARLGGIVMVMPEYRAQTPLPLADRPKPLTSTERELLLGFLHDVADYADKLSVTVGVEAINRYETHYFHRLEEVMAVIEQVGSKRLKIVADFFHMSIEERDTAASLENAAGYIGYVQLGDSNRELPGQGHTDFRPGFAALKRMGYDGYLALECRIPRDPEREFPECIRFVKHVWQNA